MEEAGEGCGKDVGRGWRRLYKRLCVGGCYSSEYMSRLGEEERGV